jgi:uncharacterized membrane protein YsdA (DUF1294 family)
MSWMRRRPVTSSLGLVLAPTFAATVALWYWLGREWLAAPWLLCWLGAVNPAAFATYGIDKWLAKREGRRVPEATLLTLAFIGGTIGAYLGMRLFRHKTVKGPFRVAFWLLVALQVVLVAIAVRLIWFK